MRGEVGWVKKTSEFALFISLSRLLFISRRWVYISHQDMQNLVDVKEKFKNLICEECKNEILHTYFTINIGINIFKNMLGIFQSLFVKNNM